MIEAVFAMVKVLSVEPVLTTNTEVARKTFFAELS
jgi:hypothetical protein